MLALQDYKNEITNRMVPYTLLKDLALICAEYVTPRIVWDRATYRDMWMYYLLRRTDYLAIPEALRDLPDPKPEYDKDPRAYTKWQVEQVKRFDQPVVYPPCRIFGLYSNTHEQIAVKMTRQSIYGYEVTQDGTPYTHPLITNPADIVTFRVLYHEAALRRIHHWDRVMGLDLIGVLPDTASPVFGIMDLS